MQVIHINWANSQVCFLPTRAMWKPLSVHSQLWGHWQLAKLVISLKDMGLESYYCWIKPLLILMVCPNPFMLWKPWINFISFATLKFHIYTTYIIIITSLEEVPTHLLWLVNQIIGEEGEVMGMRWEGTDLFFSRGQGLCERNACACMNKFVCVCLPCFGYFL